MIETIVMLHGFTGDPSRWDAVVAMLPQNVHVRRPALLGHASATRGLRIGSFDDEVDRIAAELRGIRNAHLVGYSLGARVGLGLLARHPGLFCAATLVGVSPGLRSEEERVERAASDATWADLLEREGIEAFVSAWEAQPLFASQGALPAEVQKAEHASRAGHDPLALARAMRVLGLASMPSMWPALSAIRIPVSLVVGEHDPKFRALAVEMQMSLPRAMTVLVPGVGHNVGLERPGAIADLLVRALGEPPGDAVGRRQEEVTQ